MPFVAPQSLAEVEAAVAAYGPAPGGVALMRLEAQAAAEAEATGVYVTWRCIEGPAAGRECARVAPGSRCLCGCALSAHLPVDARNPRATQCASAGCGCRGFDFVPSRPEELGMYWLPRRPDFNVHTWRAPCKCKHGHDSHEPRTRGRCRKPGCGCARFVSDYACITCDLGQEAHETMFELEAERVQQGRSVGLAFRPLAESAFLQAAVLGERGARRQLPGCAGAPRDRSQALGGPAGARAARAGVRAGPGGRGGGPSQPWEPATPTVRLGELVLPSGARALVLTNAGAPLPVPGRDWTRPSAQSRAGPALVGGGGEHGGSSRPAPPVGGQRSTLPLVGSRESRARHLPQQPSRTSR